VGNQRYKTKIKIKVFRNETKVAFENSYTLKDFFENWFPLDGEKKFSLHLIVPRW
jgi:hypothetical protein